MKTTADLILPKAPRTLKQSSLADVADKRQRLTALKRDVKQLEDELTKDELLLVHAVKVGATVEKGDYGCSVETTAGARRPAWKDYYAQAAGPEAVERAIAETAPSGGGEKLILTVKGMVVK